LFKLIFEYLGFIVAWPNPINQLSVNCSPQLWLSYVIHQADGKDNQRGDKHVTAINNQIVWKNVSFLWQDLVGHDQKQEEDKHNHKV
jgi:hypothetical protein